jgi:hypothetical protein
VFHDFYSLFLEGGDVLAMSDAFEQVRPSPE